MERTFHSELALQVGMTYGLFVAAVGVIGYIQAGSLISMVAGIASGCVASGAAYLGRTRLNLGLKLLLGTAVILTFVFHRRYQATQQFMPGAFMALNSALIVIVCSLALKSNQQPAVAEEKKKTSKKKTN